ncbi:hypothetical protein JXB41_07815 [Candidatus Woesearchaeota archaeon]|nr:hypothetical protein [Candidatus Woesearchaeota archaeon]
MPELNTLNLVYIGLGVKKEIKSGLKLDMNTNVNSIHIDNNNFTLKIIIPDIVDLEEFSSLLNRDKKRIEILSHLTKDNKNYRGKRKFLWKNNKIVMSQGGIRMEFDEDSVEKLKSITELIKRSYSKF